MPTEVGRADSEYSAGPRDSVKDAEAAKLITKKKKKKATAAMKT